MSQETISEIPKLTIRAQEDFHALLERGRPGGTSPDSQYFIEEDKHVWIGKSSVQALSKPEARHPLFKAYYEEYKEWLGLSIYRLLEIPTPLVCLSSQLPVAPQEGAVEDFDYTSPCLHVMSQFEERFQHFGEHFLAGYRQETMAQAKTTTIQLKDGEMLPLQGFGAALAVGCFIYDLDCFGRSGGNMGYIVETNEKGERYAKIFKIDPGFAFSFLEQFDREEYNFDDPRQRKIRFAPGKMEGGQTCIIRYDELTIADQREFAQMARKILQTPRSVFKTLVDQVVVKEGFTPKQAELLLNGLLARKSKFLNGFAPEVSSQLKAEVLTARDQLMRALVKKPTTPSENKMQTTELEVKRLRQPSNIPLVENPSLSVSKDKEDKKDKKGRQADKTADEKLLTSPSAFSVDKESKYDVPSSDSSDLRSFLVDDSSQDEKGDHSTTTVLSADKATLLDHYVTIKHGAGVIQTQLAVEQIRGGLTDSKTSRCLVFQVPQVNAHFSGRAVLLTNLAKQLHTQRGSLVTQSISGLGGVGKTQLAARYAEFAATGAKCGDRNLRYRAVLWLYAEQDLGVQFQAMADLWCDQPEVTVAEAPAVVYAFLRDKPALIVFDNALDAELLTPFLPPAPMQGLLGFLTGRSTPHHILITSRNPNWSQIPTLALEGFTLEETRAYVRQRLPEATDNEIEILVTTVSNLPLALSHAVAYVAEGHCSLAEYPQHFALHQLSLGGQTTETNYAEDTVLTTFLLTMARLQRQHPCTKLILEITAYLAPEDIPISLLIQAKFAKRPIYMSRTIGNSLFVYIESVYTVEELQDGVDALINHALLLPGKTGGVNIHRVIQEVVRSQLSLPEQHQRLSTALELADQAYPEGRGRAADEARKKFIPHLTKLIQHQNTSGRQEDLGLAQIIYLLAETYIDIGEITKARELLQQVLIIKQGYYGLDHWQTAHTLMRLGHTYYVLDDLDNARDLIERSLNIKEDHHGPDHPSVAISLVNLSNVYSKLEDQIKRRDLLIRALKIEEANYGLDHVELANILGNLGNSYGSVGAYGQQRDLLERVLKIKEAQYGADHPEVAIALINLGSAYRNLNNLTKSRHLLERALKIEESYFGTDNLALVATLVTLGNTYFSLGILPKAQETLVRALNIIETHHGTDHWKLGTILHNLSNVYGRLNDLELQGKLLLRALKIQEKHCGPNNPAIAFTLLNLATVYENSLESENALAAVQRAYYILFSHPAYGEHNPRTQFCLETGQSLGFTIPQLRALVEKEDHKLTIFPMPSISSVIQITQFAPPRSRSSLVEEREAIGTQQILGRTVVGLVDAIADQLKTRSTQIDWDPNTASTVASCVVDACAKGSAELERQLKEPHLHFIPTKLVPLIRHYLDQYPVLLDLNRQQDLAKQLNATLCAGQVQALRQRYGTPPLFRQKIEDKRSCFCLVM